MSKSPHQRVREYVSQQFKGQKLILDISLDKKDKTTDIFGYMGMIVLTKKIGDYIHYKPIFKNL